MTKSMSAILLAHMAFAVNPEADLNKIDRSIRREPSYQAKAPGYCLLVFGPEARDRVWLVRDGRTVFVDRNGNGDLTEPGEKMEPSNHSDALYQYEAVWLQLKNGKWQLEVHTYKSPRGKGFPDESRITVTGSDKKTYGAWGDENGPVHFAGRARDASIIHFGGPLQMGFEVQQPLVKKTKDTYELMVGVGTKGLGNGSFAHLKYWNDAIPENVRPGALLEFPKKGEVLVRLETELKERC